MTHPRPWFCCQLRTESQTAPLVSQQCRRNGRHKVDSGGLDGLVHAARVSRELKRIMSWASATDYCVATTGCRQPLGQVSVAPIIVRQLNFKPKLLWF